LARRVHTEAHRLQPSFFLLTLFVLLFFSFVFFFLLRGLSPVCAKALLSPFFC